MPTESSPPDARGEPRYEVAYRVRTNVAGDRGELLLVVNVSTRGLMARTEAAFAVDQAIVLPLPEAGDVPMRVRWVLGGRIGCVFDQAIPPAGFDAMLQAMLRSE